jgi:hypothetical protein
LLMFFYSINIENWNKEEIIDFKEKHFL